MFDLDQFKTSQLYEPTTFEKVKKEVEDIVFYQDIDRADILAHQIELKLGVQIDERNPSPQQVGYLKLVKILRFLSLPISTEAEIRDLFQQHLADVLDVENLDVVERLERKFTILPWDYRDQIKNEILQVLYNNNERITSKKLETEGRESPPTLANWLKSFVRNFGSDKVNKLKKAQYLTNDPNVVALNREEKNKITNLLNLYDSLKISSLTPEGTDPFITYIENGRIKSLENGRIIDLGISTTPEGEEKGGPLSKRKLPSKLDIPQAAPPLDPLDLLKQKYQQYRIQRQHVLKIEDKILVKTQGEVEEIKKELAVASRQGDKERVIACLKILARQKVLITALGDNPAWFEAVSGYISEKYSSKNKPAEIQFAISNLKLDPTTLAALSEFLQYLLRGKLKMSENDSALVGVDIGQMLGGRYQGLAYGNEETGDFEWTKNKIGDKRLISNI